MNAINEHFRTQYGLPLHEVDHAINVDLFAGGGGASTGIELGLDRPVHIAINHNPNAISMHQANHPGCLHLETDVWEVDPVEVLRGRTIGWFHASPDCTHHSQAAGGQPRKKEIRDLSWVVLKWAGIGKPLRISLENVKQIRQWGPLIAKRCKKTGRVVTTEQIVCPETGKNVYRVAEPGERIARHEQYLVPDPKRKGQTWKKFLKALRSLGYTVGYQILKACDFGAPTIRERLYLVARRDEQPVEWERPSHAENPDKDQQPYRTGSECIDWSIESKSIFNRKRPLAEKTLVRIAKGIQREVIERGEPFIVPFANWSQEAVYPLDKPLNTITAWPKGGSFALVTAFLAQANGGFNTTHSKGLDEPITTITKTGSQQQLVELKLSKDNEEGALRCAAFLMRYYSVGGQWGDLREPFHTMTTKDRLALVTVWIKGDPFVIVDICIRMLWPHELYAGQGFPPNYIISHGHDGRKFTKEQQVFMCGNSVCPQPMAAIVRANNPYIQELNHQTVAA